MTSKAILQFGPPASGGLLDSGKYQPQYKATSAQTWTDAPAIPYCTPTRGSFPDAFSNVWTIDELAVVTVNGIGATSTVNAAQALLVNGVVWYQSVAELWYSYTPTGPISDPNSPALVWGGPFRTSPLMGVAISGLPENTLLDFRVYVSNSLGNGLPSPPITKLTTPGAPPPPPVTPAPPPTPPPPPPVPPPPPPVSTFKFVAWGDIELALTQGLANTLNPAFTLYTGDISEGWDQTAATAWKTALGTTLSNKTFAIRGAQDVGNDAGWQSFFDFPTIATNVGATNYAALYTDFTYAFQYQNSFFVGIDGANGDFINCVNPTIIDWVDQQITAAESRGVVNTHIWSYGPIYYVDGFSAAVSTAFTAMCNKHPTIKTFFHGREHVLAYVLLNSSRISNITHPFVQLDSGTAGTDLGVCTHGRSDWCRAQAGLCLVTVTGATTKVDFYNVNGSLIKTVTV